MFVRYVWCSAALWVRRRLLITGLLLVGVALQVTLPGPVAHAATDPQVLIAVDVTTPSCYFLISPGNHTSSGDDAPLDTLSTTRISCPVGTVIVTATIPRSQAKANNEAYLPLLSADASSSQQIQWEDQVHQLIQAKRHSLQVNQANQTVRPLTTCGYTAYVYSGYQIIFDDYIQGRADYYLSSDCSTIFLDTVHTDAGYVPYNNPVYWTQFNYSDYRVTCYPTDYDLYPYTTYSFNPNVTKPSGLDALNTYQQGGSGCLVNGGGTIYTMDIGTLN